MSEYNSREWKAGDVALVQCSDGEWRSGVWVATWENLIDPVLVRDGVAP